MKIEVNIEKKYFLTILGVIIILGGVIAFNPSGQGGNPSVMGHSGDELLIDLDGDGISDGSLNQLIQDGSIGGGAEEVNLGCDFGKVVVATDGKLYCDSGTEVFFGGIYGAASSKYSGSSNPLTGSKSCPAGYSGYEFSQFVPYYTVCLAFPGEAEKLAEYGGGWGGTGVPSNPLTGSASCPAGYTEINLPGYEARPINFCYTTDLSNKVLDLGGFYGGYGDGNPVTEGQSCPAGYSGVAVYHIHPNNHPYFYVCKK